MKTTKCKTCGSADVTVTVTVNPNDTGRITDYCHNDETITEDGWCNNCCDYTELETIVEVESGGKETATKTPFFFKRHRTEKGSFTEWYPIDALPDNWQEGTRVNCLHGSRNKLYLVSDDSVRYYEMTDGVLCFHCNHLIDKKGDLYAEDRNDCSRCLCKQCWGGINNGKIDLPAISDGQPIYRLINSPVLGE